MRSPPEEAKAEESDEAARREVEALDALEEADVDGGDGSGAGVDEDTLDVPPPDGDRADGLGPEGDDFIIGA